MRYATYIANFLIPATLSGCVGTFGESSRPRTPLYLAFAATAADTATTLWLSNGGQWNGRAREGDPVLGTRPDAVTLLGALALATIGEWIAWRYVHPYAVLPVIGAESAIATSNSILATTGGRR
jgi:hypothetical protein